MVIVIVFVLANEQAIINKFKKDELIFDYAPAGPPLDTNYFLLADFEMKDQRVHSFFSDYEDTVVALKK